MPCSLEVRIKRLHTAAISLFVRLSKQQFVCQCELLVLCEKLNLFVELPLCHAGLHNDGQKQSLFDLP